MRDAILAAMFVLPVILAVGTVVAVIVARIKAVRHKSLQALPGGGASVPIMGAYGTLRTFPWFGMARNT